MRQRLPAVDSIGYAIKTIVIVVKPFYHFILGIEGFDNAQPAQSLLYDRHQQSPLILPFERTTFQFLTDLSHNVSCRRKQNQDKKSKLPTNGEHGRQTYNNHNGILEHHIERCHYRIFYLPYISRHTGHDIAFLLTGEKTDRQAHYFFIHIIANIAHDSRPKRYHEIGAQIGSGRLEKGHHH